MKENFSQSQFREQITASLYRKVGEHLASQKQTTAGNVLKPKTESNVN